MTKNQSVFYYSLYEGMSPIVDDNGYSTGEFEKKYSDPAPITATLSAVTGSVQAEMFGSDERYDRVFVVHDKNCPIDEHSILFIDNPPEYDSEGNLIFDYTVTKVAKSLNTSSYAISKVTVS